MELEKVVVNGGSTSTISTWFTTMTVSAFPTGYKGIDGSQQAMYNEQLEQSYSRLPGTGQTSPIETSGSSLLQTQGPGAGSDLNVGPGFGPGYGSDSESTGFSLPPTVSPVDKSSSIDLKPTATDISDGEKNAFTKSKQTSTSSKASAATSTIADAATATSAPTTPPSDTSYSSSTKSNGKYPFEAMIVFGDNLR